jgi:hypothetical protein
MFTYLASTVVGRRSTRCAGACALWLGDASGVSHAAPLPGSIAEFTPAAWSSHKAAQLTSKYIDRDLVARFRRIDVVYRRFLTFCRDRMLMLLDHGIALLFVFDGDKLPAKLGTENDREACVCGCYASLLCSTHVPSDRDGAEVEPPRSRRGWSWQLKATSNVPGNTSRSPWTSHRRCVSNLSRCIVCQQSSGSKASAKRTS